ncbi:hypothetical protein [Vulcanisaeta souniana]|uniref:Uncharacterized protein n=1 Tax=Vulcanisaeta souniana JCM 11219 TaxID=1293586 RepID=A0A830E5T8_9CREN|nr:hypothetical protein [Vulcanisaeta souniana]BDR91579.1 hypothetical protein Vsou_06720 [Vulcanisaeta souniana JCM 11219]GGI74324.1 hypothetical protein GCM10007112_08880 [Vulcanisaeta souniana JCM 11219]
MTLSLRICWGKRTRGSERLKCGEEIEDPKIIEEVNKLINEFLARVERYRDVLLNDENTPFDYAINALSDWLLEIKARANRGDDDITRLRKAVYKIGMKMLKLVNRTREGWLKIYRKELKELIKKLRSGEVKIAISGDPINAAKSFIAHLYTEHLAISVKRTAKSGSIIIRLTLNNLKGIHIDIPRFFDDLLRPMQYGLMLTDGSIHERGYPVMGTNYLWQVIAWLMAWPGKNYMRIHNLNINENSDVKITWQLMAIGHKLGSKVKIAKEVLALNNDGFAMFLLFAILGDGSINTKEKIIMLILGKSKYELWKDIIKRMMGLNFKDYDNKYKKEIKVYSSRAVTLAQSWLSEPRVRTLIEDLSRLPDAEKLRNLIELTKTRIKPLGRSMVEVISGVWMNTHVKDAGRVELRIKRSRLEDAVAIQDRLRKAGFNARLRGHNGKFEVYINQDEVNKRPELIIKVCEVLKSMYEETLNENNIKRIKKIIGAMTRFNCQDCTQGP